VNAAPICCQCLSDRISPHQRGELNVSWNSHGAVRTSIACRNTSIQRCSARMRAVPSTSLSSPDESGYGLLGNGLSFWLRLAAPYGRTVSSATRKSRPFFSIQ